MQKRVVIVGGGFAGMYIARRLQDDYSVTLIDSKDYFEFTPSVLRTIVEPQHIKKIQAKHQDYLPRSVIIKDEIAKISGKDVITSTKAIPYDYLVICTGSIYGSKIKDPDAMLANRADE